ncbi:hypothetical protein PR048_026677 [Dryococelus australis]|uniref:Uncharacterized protein n=1 Tax=Dryococelus australis TaxID=614101 RepID=A0ABQ9GM05_9NEOP|nr:hypothetical protein PR048_026677 [Dryococelus australis]
MQRDENTARQLRALRLVAMAYLMYEAVSTLSLLLQIDGNLNAQREHLNSFRLRLTSIYNIKRCKQKPFCSEPNHTSEWAVLDAPKILRKIKTTRVTQGVAVAQRLVCSPSTPANRV